MPAIQNYSTATHTRFDSPEQEAFLNLWRTYDRLRAFEDDVFRLFDLTPQQYNVLRLLRGAAPHGLPTLQLAERLVSRAPDITRMLDKLEQAGHLVRQRSAEDRRQVLVSITPTGIGLLNELAEPLRACHDRQLGHLAPGDLTQLTRLLREARVPHEATGGFWQR